MHLSHYFFKKSIFGISCQCLIGLSRWIKILVQKSLFNLLLTRFLLLFIQKIFYLNYFLFFILILYQYVILTNDKALLFNKSIQLVAVLIIIEKFWEYTSAKLSTNILDIQNIQNRCIGLSQERQKG